MRATLKPKYNDEYGIWGYKLIHRNGFYMPEWMESTSASFQLVHDIVEHLSFNNGNPHFDEMTAIGAMWFCRSDRIGGQYHAPDESMCIEIANVLNGSSYYDESFNIDFPYTGHESELTAFLYESEYISIIKKYLEKNIKLTRKVRSTVRKLLTKGYKKAQKIYSSRYKAGLLFFNIESMLEPYLRNVSEYSPTLYLQYSCKNPNTVTLREARYEEYY